MTNTEAFESALGASYTLTIMADALSGWTCVQVPDSAALLGTGRAVKVRARVNGHPYEATMLPVGGGVHMLPLRAPFRRQQKLEIGHQIELILDAMRISNARSSAAQKTERPQSSPAGSGD